MVSESFVVIPQVSFPPASTCGGRVNRNKDKKLEATEHLG